MTDGPAPIDQLMTQMLKSFTTINLLALMMIALTACGRPEFVTSPLINIRTPDISQSSIELSGSMIADGRTPVVITLTLRDGKGKGISGVAMIIEVTGAGNAITQCSLSDSSGVARCSFISDVIGLKTVKALGLVTLTQTITLNAPAATQTLFGVVAMGDAQTTSNGQKVIAASGIPESQIELSDSTNTVRAISSHLATTMVME